MSTPVDKRAPGLLISLRSTAVTIEQASSGRLNVAPLGLGLLASPVIVDQQQNIRESILIQRALESGSGRAKPSMATREISGPPEWIVQWLPPLRQIEWLKLSFPP